MVTTRSREMVLKGCNRCGGDLYAEEDYGRELVCLQCGGRQRAGLPRAAGQIMPAERQTLRRVA